MDYEKQATDFLAKHGIEFSAEFLFHGKHFIEDDVKRDIWDITLSRGKSVFKTRFGQSINNSIYATEKDFHKAVLSGREITLFKLSEAFEKHRSKKRVAPTAYSLLACLTKNNPHTFEDFCAECGYDTDSRKAEKIYNDVVEEWLKVSAFFTAGELKELRDIN